MIFVIFSNIQTVPWTDSTGIVIAVIALVLSVISTVTALISFMISGRKARIDLRYEFIKRRQENYAEIRIWAHTCIKKMTETSSLCEYDPKRMKEGDFFNQKIKLINDISYFIDQGRLYLPNRNHEEYGTEKPWAFQGVTRPAITRLKEFLAFSLKLNYLNKEPNIEIQKKLNHIKRDFVSEVQMILEVRQMEIEFIELINHYQKEIKR